MLELTALPEQTELAKEEDEERRAVMEHVVWCLTENLLFELMHGLRLR